jgi:nucleoside-diphosphate-sugar epimerase
LTGRSGFTGRYVSAALEAAGYEVFGLSNTADGSDSRTVVANLLDKDAVRTAVQAIQPDVVLHLAAIAFVAHDNVDEMYRVNVVGTRNLLAALAENSHKPDLVVLASSANIYGNTDVDPIDESVPPAPANDYAVSKLAMEYMARLWSERLPVVIVRPFNYTGVGQGEQYLIPKIVGHFRRGEKAIELGNTHVVRDFGDVRDVAKAYVALVKHKPVNRVFNICTGVGHSLEDIIAAMSDIAGYRIQVNVNPKFVRSNDVARLVGANDAIATLLEAGARTLLKQTLAWMFAAN